MAHSDSVSRRTFLNQSLAVGAAGVIAGTAAADTPQTPAPQVFRKSFRFISSSFL